MPKGVVPERLVACRACGTEFLSTRAGKAAFYCRTPECDKQRKTSRFTVANVNGRRADRPLTADALIARRERERERFERQWRRIVEPWVRNVIAARRREQRAVATAARKAEQQRREREKFNRQADRLRPRVQAAVSRALDLGAELAILEAAATGTPVRASAGSLSSRLDDSDDLITRYVRQHLDDVAFLSSQELAHRIGVSSSSIVRFAQQLGFRGYPEMQRAAQNEYRGMHGGTIVLHDGTTATATAGADSPAPEPVVERAIFQDELLEQVADMLLERGSDPVPGRQQLQRAVVRCARATGLEETHAALRALAVEALAWARLLPQRVNAADIDTQAMRDAA